MSVAHGLYLVLGSPAYGWTIFRCRGDRKYEGSDMKVDDYTKHPPKPRKKKEKVKIIY